MTVKVDHDVDVNSNKSGYQFRVNDSFDLLLIGDNTISMQSL